MTNPNEPTIGNDAAFARPFSKGQRDDINVYEEKGLTKREYFAAMALSRLAWETEFDDQLVTTAKKCVEMADALIAELNKEPKP